MSVNPTPNDQHNISNDQRPALAAGLGMLVFLGWAVWNSLTGLPNMDEASYLVKGFTFLTGKYSFMQPGTYWFNKMYTTFYLFGFVQWLFGPGLWAPRITALVLAVGSVVILMRTLAKAAPGWPAAILVWGMVISSEWMQVLSKANSQVLVHFLLCCMLAIYILPERKKILDVLGAICMAFLLLTRENMWFIVVPWLAFLWFYSPRPRFWLSFGVFAGLFTAGMALFYPQILILWGRVFSIKTLDAYQSSMILDEPITMLGRVMSVVTGLKEYMPSLFAFVVSLPTLRFDFGQCQKWDHRDAYKWFLSVAYVMLLGTHLVASVGLSYCVYCFSTYEAFFSILPWLLFAISANEVFSFTASTKVNLLLVPLSIAILVAGLFYNNLVGRWLAVLPVPRGFTLSSFAPLGAILTNKMGLQGAPLYVVLSLVFSLVIAVLVVAGLFFLNRTGNAKSVVAAVFGIASVLWVGTLLLDLRPNRCGGEIIPAWYQSLGSKIKGSLPSAPVVYIDGANAALPLMYFTDVQFFPPQVNNTYSFRNSPNTHELQKGGYWNEELRQTWFRQANTLILDKRSVERYEKMIDPEDWVRKDYAFPEGDCTPVLEYYVFIRK